MRLNYDYIIFAPLSKELMSCHYAKCTQIENIVQHTLNDHTLVRHTVSAPFSSTSTLIIRGFVFCCHQSSQWNSQETEVHFN